METNWWLSSPYCRYLEAEQLQPPLSVLTVAGISHLPYLCPALKFRCSTPKLNHTPLTRSWITLLISTKRMPWLQSSNDCLERLKAHGGFHKIFSFPRWSHTYFILPITIDVLPYMIFLHLIQRISVLKDFSWLRFQFSVKFHLSGKLYFHFLISDSF